MRRRTLVALATLFLVACGVFWPGAREASTQAGPTSYTVTDIGSLGGAITARAATDDLFYVVGSGVVSGGATRPFRRSWFTGLTALPTLGGQNGDAYAVSGDLVVGRSQLSSGKYHATVWSNGTVRDLGTLGGAQSVARGVNGYGIAVGSAETPEPGATQAFMFDLLNQGAVMTPINVDFGGNRTVAHAINDKQSIVGTANLAGNAVSHAFLWAGGVATDLGSPGGTSVALAVNELDHVAGYWSSTDGKTTRAFVYRDGAMHTLPGLGGAVTKALAINDDDVIVGEADTSGGVRHAVIWREGAIVDLNTLIPGGSGWVLQAATSIDHLGEIVGYGTKGGQSRSFVLLPPSDLYVNVDSVMDESTNYPNPHEAGHAIPFGAWVQNSSPYWATGVVVTSTLTGPIEFETWSTSGLECTKSGQTLTCRATRPVEPGGLGVWVMMWARSTAAGTVGFSATVRADQPDPDVSNNTGSKTNRAISLADFSLATPIVGGKPALGHVTLTSPAGQGDSHVRVVSSNPAVASVPSIVDVKLGAYGGVGRDFYVTTQPVSSVTDVQITATYGLVPITRTLRIIPFAPTPFGGTARPVPGQIEAEDYDTGGEGIAYHDTTSGNSGGRYRTDAVDISQAADAGGGFNIGYAAVGEWLNYTVDVGTGGNFLLEARVASKGSGSTLHVEAKGVNVSGTMAVPDTGAWQTWRTISAPVALTSGRQSLRLVFDKAGVNGAAANVNWIRLSPAGAKSTPFSGTPVSLPGTVQAEAFDAGGEAVAYHDTTFGNSGGAYRTTAVDIATTTDTGGGYVVGYTKAGEWLNYTVNVPTAGTYTLSARVSSNGAGGTFHVEFGGVDKTGPITVASTGSWSTFQTITRPVTLPAGTQIMRVVMDANGATNSVANVNFVAIAK